MKTTKLIVSMACALAVSLLGAGCTTTYDSRGYPVQTVTPEGAALGVAAAGLVGYALGRDSNDNHHYYRGHYNKHSRYNYPSRGRYYHH